MLRAPATMVHGEDLDYATRSSPCSVRRVSFPELLWADRSGLPPSSDPLKRVSVQAREARTDVLPEGWNHV